MLLIDLLGWSGALLLLTAYGLVSSGRLDATGKLFQLLNVLGAMLLVVNSGYYSAYPSASLNVIWAIIGLAAVARKIRGSGVPPDDSE